MLRFLNDDIRYLNFYLFIYNHGGILSHRKSISQLHKRGGLSFTCDICTETLPLCNKFENSECSYTHHFCTDCIAKYIEVKAYDDNTPAIKCPDCSVNLDLLSCRSILPPKLFVRWCDLLCESEILAEFVDKQAYCPNCFELVLNECGGVTREARCPNCKKLFCFRCMIPWRVNHHCTRIKNEVIIRDKNDLLFMETVARKAWTRCPTCKCYVQRSIGCRIIRCRCRTIFCYDCGSKLRSHGCPCEIWRRREMTPEEVRNFKVFISLLLIAVAVLLSIMFYR
ncbi:hypothetical protein MKX01_001551 [Papaver californicum]|nr:hypothetical protein MKX01_001551 [Papaver californicum]